MSVLAHVVVGGAQQNEPAATQALAYILKSCPDLARAFVGLLRTADIAFDPGRVEAELTVEEDSRPDLTIHDSDGQLRVFVENKFWAPLTSAQPTNYLRNLPETPPSALVFVVPEQRVHTVWRELGERCRREGLEATVTSDSGSMKSACVDNRIMMIVSWKTVLERLLDAAVASGHDTVKNDILQLQGLTGRMDSAAFLPLRTDEVTDQETARRLINYVELIDNVVNELVRAGVADTEGLRVSNTYHYAGRFFHIHADGRFETWLGIDLTAWRDEGISPLWWRFRTITGVVRGHFENIPELCSDVGSRDDGLYVPVRLKTGVERDGVVSDAVAQMKRIADQVLKTVPNQKPAL